MTVIYVKIDVFICFGQKVAGSLNNNFILFVYFCFYSILLFEEKKNARLLRARAVRNQFRAITVKREKIDFLGRLYDRRVIFKQITAPNDIRCSRRAPVCLAPLPRTRGSKRERSPTFLSPVT